MKLYARIFKIFLSSVIVLLLLNKAYEKGHAKYYMHETERFDVLFNKKIDYDILLAGSSRTHVHYNPTIIDSITHLTSYNFGVEGGNLLEINLWVQLYLSNHNPPKAIVLDLPVFAFDIDRRPFFNHTIYLPYLNDDIVFNTLSGYKKTSLYKYLPFFALTEADDYNKINAVKGWMNVREEAASHYTYNGYADNGTAILHPSLAVVRDTQLYKLAEKGKTILTALIDTCKRKNIQLMLAYSPEYYDTDYHGRSAFLDYVANVAISNSIPFYNYTKSSICADSNLFANRGHLNKYGADLFSRDIAEKISRQVK